MIPGATAAVIVLLLAAADTLPRTIVAYVLAFGAIAAALAAIWKLLTYAAKLAGGVSELVDAVKGDGNGEPGLLKRTENAATLARDAKAAAATTHQLAEKTHAIAKANGEVSQSILVRLDSGDLRFQKIEEILDIVQDEETRRVKRALDAAADRRHPNAPDVDRHKP